MRILKTLCTIIVLIAFCVMPAFPSGSNDASIFFKAKSNLNKNNLPSYYFYKEKLKNSPLLPYLQFIEITSNITKFDDQTIENFLIKQKGTYWDKELRPLWLNILAKDKKWDLYAKIYQRGNSTDQRCWYWQAKYLQGNKEKSLTKFTNIWVTGRSLPDSCDFMIEKWNKSKYKNLDIVWKRINLVMKNNNLSLAIYLSKDLKKKNKNFLMDWIKVKNNTVSQIKSFINKYHTNKQFNGAVIDILQQFIRKSPDKGIVLWGQIKNSSRISFESKIKINTYIAIFLARKYDKDAFNWFNKISNEKTSNLLWQWKARLSIRYSRWSSLRTIIESMPTSLSSKNEWKFWLAKSYLESGNSKKANDIFKNLSKSKSFYGFLASDQLNISYNIKNSNTKASKELIKKIRNNYDIKQVKQLIEIKEYKLAYQVWRYVVRKYSKPEKLASAEIAMKWGYPDMSIYAYALSGNGRNNLVNYYPIAYKKQVETYSQKYNINPAWVWSLMRQESRFNIHAESYMGALGLMQLLPSTALFIANRYKITYGGELSLFNPNTNIRIGVAHLDFISSLFDRNIVLATASYNAGQGNVAKWLPNYEVMGSINWIETIPFSETRKYLRNVLSNIVIYEIIQMKNTSYHLSSSMKNIKPR